MTATSCHVTLRWSEGIVCHDGFAASTLDARAAGAAPPERTAVPEVVMALARELPRADARLRAVLDMARFRELPARYTGRFAFGSETPLLVEHEGDPIGMAWDVRMGDGLAFVAEGRVHPDHAPMVRALPWCSPGWYIMEADIEAFGGEDVLHVTHARLAELSVTASPARSGTSVVVSPPKPEWELPPVSYGTFRALSDEGEARFQAARRERLRAEAMR